jgi:hypothetical protein
MENNIFHIKDWLNDVWLTEETKQVKRENFTALDNYLIIKPRTILEIGCGLAWESRFFNEKYGSELWLLDGDANEGNKNKSRKSSDINYHQSTDDFLFYTNLDKLKETLDQLGTQNYSLIDCNNINIPNDLKFDLIMSWASCGLHYPVATYKDLIKKHSHNDTIVSMDLRKIKGKLIVEEDIEIVHTLQVFDKFNTSILKIKG